MARFKTGPYKGFEESVSEFLFIGPQVSNDSKPKLLIFFVPGNPGPVTLYKDFLIKLFDRLVYLYPIYDVFVNGVSHAQHQLRLDSTTNYVSYTLDFQINHQQYFIQKNIQENQENIALIMIIGHSIGAYMALQVYENLISLKSSPRVYLLLLMPFFRWSNIRLEHRLKLLTYYKLLPVSKYIAVSTAMAFNALPLALKSRLIQAFSGFDRRLSQELGSGKYILLLKLKFIFPLSINPKYFDTSIFFHAHFFLVCVVCVYSMRIMFGVRVCVCVCVYVLGLFQQRIVDNFLTMGADEIREVSAKQDHIMLSLRRFALEGGGSDTYVPRERRLFITCTTSVISVQA